MTDEKFTELVNLFVDKEISAADLDLLKAEISACPQRKRAFVERCRLHQAMQMALNPERRHPRSRQSRAAHAASRIPRGAPQDRSGRSSSLRFRFLMLSGGLVASLALAWVLLTPVLPDRSDAGLRSALVNVNPQDRVVGDPLESLGRSELRRYAAAQQRNAAQYEASLIAQMRLMGLRPELTPQDKQLREVGVAAHYQPQRSVNRAELFQRLQAQQAIPQPKLLRMNDLDNSAGASWQGGFEVMPARFGGY